MTDLLIDSNALFARTFYAAREKPYETVIAAAHCVLALLNPHRMGERIDRMLLCWDGARKNDKGRAAKPSAYHPTKLLVKEVLEGILGARSVCLECEADDAIATACARSKADHVIIATTDKDLHQLQDDRVSIFCLIGKGFISRRQITERWHIARPSHLAISLAIQGDGVDNIAGIKGWGPQKAKLLTSTISPDLPFDKVVDVVLAQIPQSKQAEFWEALNLTLLREDIEGVPEPAPFRMMHPDEVATLGIDAIEPYYSQVYQAYQLPPGQIGPPGAEA